MSDLAPGERYATAAEAEIALNGHPKFAWHADEKGDVVVEGARYQHHFVVVGTIDPETGGITLWRDDDTAVARFDGDLIFDATADEDGWLSPDEVRGAGLDDDDATIGDALAALLDSERTPTKDALLAAVIEHADVIHEGLRGEDEEIADLIANLVREVSA